MFCTNCGKEISNEQKFCDGCGMQLNAGPTKKIVTVGAATGEFIADWIFITIIIGLFAPGVISAISDILGTLRNSRVVIIIVSAIMSILTMTITCVCTTKLTFGKKIIKHEELNNFIKNICIFLIVITVLNVVYSSISVVAPTITEISTCTEDSLTLSQYLAISKIMTESNVAFVEARDMLVKQTVISAFGIVGTELLVNLVVIIVLIIPFEKKLMKKKLEAID